MAAETIGNGEIRADAVYSLPEAQARLNWGSWAFRTARRNGLTVRRVGTRSYVMGRDLLAYIETAGKVVGGDGANV